MFLHGGWDHILGSMLFLAIFGKNVEDAFGSLLYLVFYFAAMITQTAITLLFGTAAETRVPELGASGAIAAVLAAYFVLYPGSRIRTWIFPIFLIRIRAWIFLGLWFLYQLIEASFGLFSASANAGGMAFFAHVGGFMFGPAGSTAPRPGGTGSTRGATAFHGVGRRTLAATGEARRPWRRCASA
jgi:membrane associated rhomboid family serine protease